MSTSQKREGVSVAGSSEASFAFRTGDYSIEYAPQRDVPESGWITIRRTTIPDCAIGTKLANGQHLNMTDPGSGAIYRWKEPRKDRDIFRDLSVAEDDETISVVIRSSRRWADFTGTLWCYRSYPGLMRWTVSARVKTEKILDNPVEPDCRFLTTGGRVAPASHRAVRYMVQRGPASGIVYFRDLDMASDVFYFQDFTSLADLYRLTGCANPFSSYTTPGQPGAVRMGQAEGEFQSTADGGAGDVGAGEGGPLPWRSYEEKVVEYERFGYERPQTARIPAGTTLTLCDTYLYLKPAAAADPISVCKGFVESLAVVYRYIRKPPIVQTDWARAVVPRMAREIMKEENSSLLDGKHFFPRAYLRTGPDRQLWNVAQLLLPLVHYAAKYPDEKDVLKLKSMLEESLPLFYDPDYQGFVNNLPPINPDSFTHTIYIFNPAVNVADLALLGNDDARRMIVGYRDRLLQMGRTCGYVFADLWLRDYSRQRFFYQFDNTCAYVYVMVALYELSGRTDAECLAAAKAAAEQLTRRCMDLMWEVNLPATGAVACQWLSEVTGESRYRDIAFIPLANTLRWAWLWDCGYGIGEHVTTFWGFSGTPACPQTCEYESHQTRRMLKRYAEMVSSSVSPDVRLLLRDSWRRGPTQSRFALAPYAIEAGARDYIVAEGPMETDCGEIDHGSMVPFEDFRPTWGTDLEWSDNNAKIGHVGQEIYGAGGPIWYAVWQDEIGR